MYCFVLLALCSCVDGAPLFDVSSELVVTGVAGRNSTMCVDSACWTVPVHHNVMQFHNASRVCTPVRSTLVEWFGRFAVSTPGVYANHWLNIRADDVLCKVFYAGVSKSLLIYCDDKWAAAWISPQLEQWMWHRWYTRDNRLCLRMQYDRADTVHLDQCSTKAVFNANVTTTVLDMEFVLEHSTLDVLSWQGQPVLHTMVSNHDYWTSVAMCLQHTLVRKQQTRYVDANWIVERTGDFTWNEKWSTVISTVYETTSNPVVSCRLNTTQCSSSITLSTYFLYRKYWFTNMQV